MKNPILNLVLLLIIGCNINVFGTNYYVALNGDDNNPGSIDLPFATWQKGINTALAGDTIFIRGGVFMNKLPLQINPDKYGGPLGTTGTADNPIVLMGYPGEWPILDCSLHCSNIPANPFGRIYNSAIGIVGVEHWKFKDFEIRNVFQCDSAVDGAVGASYSCNLTFDHIIVHNIGQRGFYISGGCWNEVDTVGPGSNVVPKWGFGHPDTTRFINCDVYDLCDSLVQNIGNAADGYKTGHYDGNYIEWTGCRVWNYSDDGWDPSALSGGTRIFRNCWVMAGDKYKETDGGDVERNGFKCAGPGADWSPNYSSNKPYLEMYNCLAYNCTYGFYELDHTGYLRNNAFLCNNTAFRCDIGFASFPTYNVGVGPRTSVYRNNISFGATSNDATGKPYDLFLFGDDYNISNCTWQWSPNYPYQISNPAVNMSESAFYSVNHDEIVAQITAPRKPDGSLPDMIALMPSEGSVLIDKGIDVGLPFSGISPDIGAFEYTSSLNSKVSRITKQIDFSIIPNPTDNYCRIIVNSDTGEKCSIKIYSLTGELVYGSPDFLSNTAFEIQTSDFKKGVYVVGIKMGQFETQFKKLIVK